MTAKKQAIADTDLDRIKDMQVNAVLLFFLADGFDTREAHFTHMRVNERAQRYGIVVRIQKYLHKMFVIRVA